MAILPSACSHDTGGLAVHDIARIAEGEGDIGKSIRRKVFISYHVEDRDQVKQFADSMGSVIVDKSVKDSDIDDRNIKTATVRQKIRDNFIADASVTVVLIGPRTWQRKHVDWEVGSSLRQTKKNPRCGLLGILLPNHPDYGKEGYNPRLIPPRLADNCQQKDPYAIIYDLPRNQVKSKVRSWIDQAFERRSRAVPTNKRKQFARNRRGNCMQGWKD